jgi:phosphoserine aminotransferase
MTKGGKLIDGIFVGETINTPSMLCVEDYLDALNWAKSIGGFKGLSARADANLRVLADWAARTPWIDFFAEDSATRSNTSVTLKVVDPAVTSLDLAGQEAFVRAIAARLDKEGVAYDIAFHRDAPPHFRIWAGATIEASDLKALTAWLEWGYAAEKANLKQAA